MTPTYWLWSLSSVRQSWVTPHLSRLSILTWASWKVLLELCLWVLLYRSYSMVSLFSVRTNRFFRHPRRLKSLAESYIYFSRYSKDSIWIKLTVSIIVLFKPTYTHFVYRWELFGMCLRAADGSNYPEGHVSVLDTTTSALSKQSIVELAWTLCWQSRCSIASVRKHPKFLNAPTYLPSVSTITWLTSLCHRSDLWMLQREWPFPPYFYPLRSDVLWRL